MFPLFLGRERYFSFVKRQFSFQEIWTDLAIKIIPNKNWHHSFGCSCLPQITVRKSHLLRKWMGPEPTLSESHQSSSVKKDFLCILKKSILNLCSQRKLVPSCAKALLVTGRELHFLFWSINILKCTKTYQIGNCFSSYKNMNGIFQICKSL